MHKVVTAHFQKEIDKDNYTLSLLEYCIINNIIDMTKQTKIKNVLDNEFIEMANQFTMRASSTISKKQAELIYNSILYQSDVCLLSLNDDENAVRALLNEDITEILNHGKQLIFRYTEECRTIFKLAYKNKLNIQIYEYNFIMDKAFDEFNMNYSARFDAENICTSIDYPLMNKQAYALKSKGVVFIKEYYTAIMYENIFCSYFNMSDIIEVLNGFGAVYNCHYSELLFNIAEVILKNSLASMLLGKKYNEIKLTSIDIKELYDKYFDCSQIDLSNRINEVFSLSDLRFKDNQLKLHLLEYLPVFACELHKHLQAKNIEQYIVSTN